MIPAWICCPHCRGTLVATEGAWGCAGCGEQFPLSLGLPDLRVAADPWITPSEDRAKAVRVLTEAEPGFEAAVRHYWSITPTTSAAQAARHIDHVVHAEQRTAEWLASLAPRPQPGERWLDVGCGTADLAAAAPTDVAVTGVDIAFRWIALGQRRLDQRGQGATLLCANGERLPIAAASFDRVFLLGTIEHCADLTAILGEALRVLRPGGWLHLRTVNRLSLLPEPHVDLWGVAWLPPRLADAYARFRGREGYRHHHLRSAAQLTRGMHATGFQEVEVTAAVLLPTELRRLPRTLRPLGSSYQRMRGCRATRLVAPLLDARGCRP